VAKPIKIPEPRSRWDVGVLLGAWSAMVKKGARVWCLKATKSDFLSFLSSRPFVLDRLPFPYFLTSEPHPTILANDALTGGGRATTRELGTWLDVGDSQDRPSQI